MSLRLISNTAFSTDLPFIELDDVIIGRRSECKGLYDFTNTDCVSNTTQIGLGSKLKTLTNDRTETQTASAMSAANIQNGWFRPTSGYSIPLSPLMKLPTTCKKYLCILNMQASSTGTAGLLCSFFAHMSANNQWQYGIGCQYASNGNIQNIRFFIPNTSSAAQALIVTDTNVLSAIFDGNKHQVAYEWDGTAGTSATVKIYVDAVLVATKTVAFADAILNITGNPIVGSSSPFGGNTPTSFLCARPSLWDLTGSSINTMDILGEDLAV